MKSHLFEFTSKNKKVKCICGWERTLKSHDVVLAHKKFQAHRAEEKGR